MAHGMRDMLVRHPWVCQALAGYLQYGEAKARYDEHLLAVFERAGLGSERADLAATAVFTYVLGSALGESATLLLHRKFEREGRDPEQAFQEGMAEAAAIVRRFPRLRARVEAAEAVGYGEAPSGGFEYGLTQILDGIERDIRTA